MKKVIVGISGGVDSAVAAYLLKKEGYEVEGLFMRNWDAYVNNDYLGNPTLDEGICPQEQDYNDAKEACKILNIPLHRIDFIKEYWDYVFTYFLDELDLKRIIKRSFENRSLNEICEYLYKVTNLYNNFYAENKVLTEKNEIVRSSWLALTKLIFDNNQYLLNILGINIPEKM